MSASSLNPDLATPSGSSIPGDSPRRVRRDLRFARWYAYTIPHVIQRYRDDLTTLGAVQSPGELLARVEFEVAAECRRMRTMAGAILAVLMMPLLLAGFLWSGLYWLPVRIPWFPFERGAYGLPLFSLFEWLAFLMLAAFLAGSVSVLVEGLASTRRVSTDYRRLANATPEERSAIAEVARAGTYPRCAYLLGRAKPFEAYASLMMPGTPSVEIDSEVSV